LIFFINHFRILGMTWNSDKIKILRCRLGFSQADLARRLNCESELIQSWELTDSRQLLILEQHADLLVLLEKQAEVASEHLFQSPLAESILEETRATQIDVEAVKRRFYENN